MWYQSDKNIFVLLISWISKKIILYINFFHFSLSFCNFSEVDEIKFL